MLVLGIDTATLVCGVALVTPDRLLAEYTLQVKKTHSERLLPLLAAMLRDAGFAPPELDGVAVAVGPGSFTGVRIGTATARALGQALGIPLAGISTLEALAAQASWFNGLVTPILDARRRQVYSAVFRMARGVPVRLCADRALPLLDLLAELAEAKEPVLFTGDAVNVYREAIISVLGGMAFFPTIEAGSNRAAVVARLGLELLSAGQGQCYRELVPAYLRRSEAEEKVRPSRWEGSD